MATVIRLKRGGRKKKPYYRIVVQDSRSRTRGREVDTVGFYHPTARPEPVSQVDAHRALEWLRTGAQPSDTVRTVFSKLGIMKHFNDGTTPEDATAQVKDGAVEVKGYTPPAPPKAKPAPAPEVVETEAAAEPEAEAEAAAPAEGEAGAGDAE